MNGLIVTVGLLTAGLHGGGLLAQEASLRRSILPTAELSLEMNLFGPLEASLGYGVAWRTERFPGLESRTTYHRLPLRLGAGLPLGPVEIAGGAGPALIAARTSFDDGDDARVDTTWQMGAIVGARAETILLEPSPAGALLGRLSFDVYLRGRRTDVAWLIGVAWRFSN